MQQTSAPWLIAGDFNVIGKLEKYKDCSSPDLASMGGFVNLRHTLELTDLPTIGGLFIWTGVRHWIWTLRDSIKRPFPFQNMWIQRPDFIQMVRDCWNLPLLPSGMFRFSIKLRRLMQQLRGWNKNAFGDVHENAKEAEAKANHYGNIFDASGQNQDFLVLNQAKVEHRQQYLEE